MVRRSRESIKRAVRAGNLAPIVCPACGQRFWTVEQEQAHQGAVLYGRRVCMYAPSQTKPICQDCGMRHEPNDTAKCIEGHGEP
jgi:hypothetical protein